MSKNRGFLKVEFGSNPLGKAGKSLELTGDRDRIWRVRKGQERGFGLLERSFLGVIGGRLANSIVISRSQIVYAVCLPLASLELAASLLQAAAPGSLRQ
jgi:hypothetical protein